MNTEEDKVTLTVDETAGVLGIGRSSAYEAVRQGQLPVIRIGRRYLVPKAALTAMLNRPQPLRDAKARGDGNE